MACHETWLEILSAWHDGEATPDEVARAEAHLPRCAACRGARFRFQLLGNALRSARRCVDPERSRAARASAPSMLRPLRRRTVVTALVAGVAAMVWIHHGSRAGGTVVVDELEARHLTAFARAAPCDFESANPAAVRAWIADQFGQEVEVPSVPGARLLGVRRCNLSGKPTVSLMYRRGGEPLSLFVSPPGTPTAVESVRLAGAKAGCTVGRLGAAVCARPGRFAVAETVGSARAAIDSF
jgi:anti-sigma factor RsiW